MNVAFIALMTGSSAAHFQGVRNLIEACLYGSRLVHVSTFAIYGLFPDPRLTRMPAKAGGSAYSVNKLEIDTRLSELSARGD